MSAIPTWEYRVLRFRADTDSLQSDLDRLGQKGWELCACELGGSAANPFYRCILKRQNGAISGDTR